MMKFSSSCTFDRQRRNEKNRTFAIGLLNKIFGRNSETKDGKVMPWIPLNQIPQLGFIEK
ncbi:hypothetical protein [Flavivirga spongiicola]|uniref:Uncharacterized protein n=1 Tax=Flavivirga spongiicola TaxID=421621 RepID=A0ABU7XMT7_9FLAO|nr:hypothetical protein [Flavivirga sp. MEBiC05379]MDO5981500.1 hypothetical protein [Flavivirga sp. MEBiC05379]